MPFIGGSLPPGAPYRWRFGRLVARIEHARTVGGAMNEPTIADVLTRLDALDRRLDRDVAALTKGKRT